MKLIRVLGWIVAVALLSAPGTARAQIVVGHMSVFPAEYDFGDVVVGQGVPAVFTISNINGEPLVVTSIEVVSEGEASFSVVSDAPPPPIIIADGGEPIDVVVLFAPMSLGVHSAELRIISFEGDVSVDLQGAGVADEPSAEIMDEIIEFFETADVEGTGPGGSADNRLRAFGHMLDAADDLVASGDYGAACDQLWSAYLHADGAMLPPDFISDSPDKAELAAMLLDIMDLLMCVVGG